MLKEPVEPAANAVGGAANNVPPPAAAAANALEALLADGGGGNLQALLNLPDADDEAMVQLAIALSLQEQVLISKING